MRRRRGNRAGWRSCSVFELVEGIECAWRVFSPGIFVFAGRLEGGYGSGFEVDGEGFDDVAGRRAADCVGGRDIRAGDGLRIDRKAQEAEVILVVLLQSQALFQREWSGWVLTVELVQLAEIGVSACACDDEWQVPGLAVFFEILGEALVVVDVAGQNEVGINSGGLEGFR